MMFCLQQFSFWQESFYAAVFFVVAFFFLVVAIFISNRKMSIMVS